MRRTTPSRKEVSHERILEAAARAIRRSGYDGAAIAGIMKEAGLTHGGFYAHFDSREAMLAEAADRAGAESVAALEQRAASAGPKEAFRTLVKTYVSRTHLESAETGCPIAALGSEIPRQAPEVRHAATRRIKQLIDLVGRHSPILGQPGCREHAFATTATMVGALVLARAVDDPSLSQSMLDAAFKGLTGG
ncbi:TetR/AcrR family transcriptional regulator [Aquincola sp. S2]|uniref:TetR/AcrR family transcriptional regulator n=1 Tax=Pseudaquabacterium terrae TaxID=2732868 RepID=A0ABX2ESM4_9BURK|nr:TetR/AcrR family transcriptional regulator [Aquabacterium terrae]NRF71631.1 TetR/AcrR family transcriptional regulator [Aquabacterium terrae]